ncbi:MAG: IS701 family transposase [Planctomycetaceae bacterium]|nr:IS701 family transposase [Planctomycetaceae bacterium]
MECSFEERERELELECRLPKNMPASAVSRLEAFLQPFLVNYRRCEQQAHATSVVRGLCSDLERKNGESIACLFGLDRKVIQHFVGEARWNDRALREELARQVGSQLGEPDGVLVFDPSAFPKAGRQSVGVARQWCGRLGKLDNCQVAVYPAYVSATGHALVDTELYLPKEWTNDKPRLKRAAVPPARRRHRTRQEICLELLDRHGEHLPHGWITGDDEMGRPADFRRKLRDRNERYLSAVPCNTTIRDLEIPAPESSGTGRPAKRPSRRVDRWVAECGSDDWSPVEVRDGEKGPLSVEALKRRVETGQRARPTAAEEVLVVLRDRDRDSQVVKTDYYLSDAGLSDAGVETPLVEFCRAAKAEHRVEECLRRGKSETGLADYEVRNWVGWQHHQTLSLLAAWFLNVETRRAEKKDAGDHLQPSSTRHRIVAPRRDAKRYAPRRPLANRTTAHPSSTGTALPLETTQPTSTQEPGSEKNLGQSN